MTEQELRRRVCDRAQGWLGCREADGSHRAIIDLYNRIRPLPRGYRMSYDDPWCAAFVSAVGAACGLTDTILPECGCEPMIALYQAAGRFEEADEASPRPGDLIFYDWGDPGAGDCVGAADHVGLVTENDQDLLTVIEGNLSDAVGERKIYAGARFVRGYARPDYLSAALASPSGGSGEHSEPIGVSAAPVGTTIGRPSSDCSSDTTAEQCSALRCPSPDSALTPLPLLRRGDRGPAVRAAQLLLIAGGFRCGPSGADGDFGPATYGAVFCFQRGRRLAADGEIGPETWAKLIGEKE